MKIILGVTGSVACYKGVLISREFFKRGLKQKVILTNSALKFIRPLIFKALSNAEVYTQKDFFNSNLHIEISKWGDLLLVAPASANFISKLANGIADNLLLSVAISFNKRIILAPAMHDEMWKNKFLRENVEKLMKGGIEIIGPVYGELSGGDFGEGRMLEVNEIIDYIFKNTKKVLLVYGRTEEPIDDVRVITNRSSGKIGYFIHKALESNGILYFSFKAFMLDLIAIISYSLIYTFLKRKTPFSIIIGSIPGALPTSIGYIAMKNDIDIIAFSLFSLMFLWQPSHFIYLSLFLKDDYKNAKIPTISVKYSYEYNKILSFVYSFSIIPITIMIYYIANLSYNFLILVLFLNLFWVILNLLYWKEIVNEKIMFISSNFYVLFIFSLIVLDKVVTHKL